ncbi:MAG: hypothetical protein KZY61_14740 [Clostridiaceae bacterium]|nr:hypothetical protein [Clostridiaceae bacterium]MBW4861147.1 hypothetical protein [Clostridiaceae bacterium]MBW4869891.1 hypothetical protein [Clostridiaceae bacterium]
MELKEDDELKGYELILKSKEKYEFSKEGRLNKIIDINGNEIILDYEEDRLKRVSTLSGDIDFHYKDELLEYIEDLIGRKVSFFYEEDNLVEVNLPDNTSFKYTYDVVDRLIDVISPRNIKLVTNEYDDVSRTSKQVFPDGGIMEYRYLDDENLLELTEQNGNKIFYGRDEKFRNTKVIYEDGEEISVYYSRNNLISFTDKNGNKTRSLK